MRRIKSKESILKSLEVNILQPFLSVNKGGRKKERTESVEGSMEGEKGVGRKGLKGNSGRGRKNKGQERRKHSSFIRALKSPQLFKSIP